MSLAGVQGQLMDQWGRIMSIPMVVVSNWPAAFSFAVVDYVSEMVFRNIPRTGGFAGMIVGNFVNGARDVTKMATWDAVKNH